MQTPQYIKSLLKANGQVKQGRKVWSIDLETVWLPFFTATNCQGDTAIPAEALGQPIRLAVAKDGQIRFGNNGKPVQRVSPEISANVKLVRQNFEATLLNYAQSVIKSNPEAYKAEISRNVEAGQPVAEREQALLDEAIAKLREKELAEAMGKASQPKAEAEKELASVTS